MAEADAPASSRRAVGNLTVPLAALGVVFGDLATSPLYALQEAFHGTRGVPPTAENVVGCVSLFLWSLIVMVSLKYVVILMRADNQGEGGILALLTLITGTAWGAALPSSRRAGLVALWTVLGFIGTAMLCGDGVITPAVSVLSAVEGLAVATPQFGRGVVPLTVLILVALFAVQAKGSARVGAAFGPILAAWLVAALLLGLTSLARTPRALEALDPRVAIAFFAHNGFHGFIALGAVVLCLTGGEALYADMGHFGRRPIRTVWYGLVLPALVCNYLGQAAELLRNPAAADRPFYAMVPEWGLVPMVGLATLATIVASQALITAVFSLTNQAMQLGIIPRLRVLHTSAATRGQIYLPMLNWLLMLATLAVVIGFGSSASLAAAFGLAVSTTMAITSVLFAALARQRWGWGYLRIAAVSGGFLVVDLAFVGANTLKFADGGWLPLALGGVGLFVMTAWRTGRYSLAMARRSSGVTMPEFVAALAADPPHRVAGTAVFLTEDPDEIPTVLLHHLKHNQVLHERVVLLTLETADVPRVAPAQGLTCQQYGLGFMRLRTRHGFMEMPNVPEVLGQLSAMRGEPAFDPMTTSYYLGHETLSVRTTCPTMLRSLLQIFIWLRRNELDATQHFGIPSNRVVELGARLEIPAPTAA